MISGVTNDYTGRKVDLEAMQTISDVTKVTLVTLAIADPEGVSRRITGLQKLIQRYTILFLTALGSNEYDPTVGSEFALAFMIGGLTRRDQIVHFFTFANARITDALRREQGMTIYGGMPPADERLKEAVLFDYYINTNTSTVLLKIQITSEAGDSAIFVLPTPRTV